VRFGEQGTKRRAREIGRLTPLPDTEDPYLVYMGTPEDKNTAVFLLSTDVTATGDGVCRPRRSTCESVELRKGQTEYLEVTADDGTVTRYRLDLVRVERGETDRDAGA
jgi:hypothetical protein